MELAINDLSISQELDNEAMTNVVGRGTHISGLKTVITNGAWVFKGRTKRFGGWKKIHGKWHACFRVKAKYCRKQFKTVTYRQYTQLFSLPLKAAG